MKNYNHTGLTNDHHYTLVFLDLVSNNAEKLNKLHKENGSNINATKAAIIGMLKPNVGHGISVKAFDMLVQAFNGAHSLNRLMFLMSSHLLASEGLKVR